MIYSSQLTCVLLFGYFIFFSVIAEEVSNSTENANVSCSIDYVKVDIREVLGQWKVLELYTHGGKEGVTQYESCPHVTIWMPDDFPTSTYGPSTDHQLYHVQHITARFRQENRHLRLLWDEAGQTLEYSLYFRNDSAGFWQVLDGQNGTLGSRQNYQQFTGSIQVLKAVGNHLVLNFCQEPVGGRPAQMYSVLFSREPGRMARWEIEAVHNLLQNKQLSVASRRMVCGNKAAHISYSIAFSIVTCLFACLLSKS